MLLCFLSMALSASPSQLPPDIVCGRVLADIQYLLDVDAALRATLEITLDKRAPEYSAHLEKVLQESKSRAEAARLPLRAAITEQKRALLAEYRKLMGRREREHFLDKVSGLMLESRENSVVIEPLYEQLKKEVDPAEPSGR